MTRETHNLELSTRHQLLDLNREKVNFVLNFNIVAEDNKHFFVIILTQKEVDKYGNLDEIEMKTAPGKISGTITVKDNVYENYILLLKSNDNCKVHVDLDVEEVEPELKDVQENFNEMSEPQGNIGYEVSEDNIPIYRKTWFWIFLFILLLMVGYLGYNYIQNRKENYQLGENIAQAAKTSTNNKEHNVDIDLENSGNNIYEHKNSTYENLKNVGE
jgi:hypothetical protein